MRDPQRLDGCYARLCEIHKQYFPDLRMFQFFDFFVNTVNSFSRIDAFYQEDNTFEDTIDKFLEYYFKKLEKTT